MWHSIKMVAALLLLANPVHGIDTAVRRQADSLDAEALGTPDDATLTPADYVANRDAEAPLLDVPYHALQARDPLQHALPFIFTRPELAASVLRYTLKEMGTNASATEIPYSVFARGVVGSTPGVKRVVIEYNRVM